MFITFSDPLSPLFYLAIENTAKKNARKKRSLPSIFMVKAETLVLD